MKLLEWVSRKRRLVPGDAVADRLAELDSRLGKLEQELASAPPLLIQHADKVVIERVDLSSHLGTLQIDALEGQLNIGVTYHGQAKPDELFPLAASKGAASAAPAAEAAEAADADPRAPLYRIRPRTAKDRSAK